MLRDPASSDARPDARQPGQVVGRVAEEGAQVGQGAGRHSEARLDGGGVVLLVRPAAAADEQDAHAGPGELEEVAIAADHQHLPAGLGELARGGGEDVVGFLTFDHERGRAEALGQLADPAELRRQLGRRWAARRLVTGIDRAPAAAAGVEREAESNRIALAQELDQHRREAVERGGRLAPRGVHRRQRVMRPVDERVDIEEERRSAHFLEATVSDLHQPPD